MKNIGIYLLAVLLMAACQPGSATDIEETAQQVGDVMASMDEAGGSGGSFDRFVAEESYLRMAERYFGKAPERATCLFANTFGSCNAGNNEIVRDFNGCTIGTAALTGTVTLTWDGTDDDDCGMGDTNDTLTRVPAFTITGRRGATLTVSKTGSVGQRLTRQANSGSDRVFTFSNDGIRRVFTTASSDTLFDFTTTTTADITITGHTRASRVVDGGSLRVTNNLSGVTCDYVPNDVTWATSCNCPVSGQWTGTCSDSKATDITINGCGSATFILGTETQTLTFDRCYGT